MLEEIEIGKLVTDGLQMRAGLSRATVAEYVEALKGGDVFPPLSVVRDGAGADYLVDGFHRLAAMKRLGHTVVRCEVTSGDFSAALRAALGANAAHGLRRTNADKRRALAAAWENRSVLFEGEPSVRDLAKLCAVSVFMAHDFIKANKVLENNTSSEDAESPRLAAKDRFGVTIPERLREAFADKRLKVIVDEINDLRHQLADEVEAQNGAFAQVTQQTQIAFANAYHDLKASAPYCVCRNCHGVGCHSCAKTGFQTKAQYERLPNELKSL